ncbi:MAG: MFS transporter [Trichodesmium sp. MO_231.B1]|nr:MFS transporter [Trichodesmium sp. MO_231.B1]
MNIRAQISNKSVSLSWIKQRNIITICYWASTFCEGASRILIPLYFVSVGVSISQIGIMFFFLELSGLLTNIFSGYFLNRFGYKNGLLISLIFHSIASIGYLGLSLELSTTILLILVNTLRIFRGFGKELIKATSETYLSQFKDSNNKFMPIQIMIGGKDGIKGIGLLTGGFLLSGFGFQSSFLMLGIVTIVCFLITSRFVEDYRENKLVSLSGFWNIKKKQKILAICRALIYASRNIWLVVAVPIYLSSLGVSEVKIGTILALGFIIFGISQPFGSTFIKSHFQFSFISKTAWSYRNTLFWTVLILAIVPPLSYISRSNLISFALTILTYNALSGVATAPHNYLHIKYVNKERSSIDIACYKTIAQVGEVLGVLLSGLIYESFGLEGCIFGASLLLLCSAFLGLSLRKT